MEVRESEVVCERTIEETAKALPSISSGVARWSDGAVDCEFSDQADDRLLREATGVSSARGKQSSQTRSLAMDRLPPTVDTRGTRWVECCPQYKCPHLRQWCRLGPRVK